MPRSRDHQRPNLTTEGLVLILIDVAHELRLYLRDQVEQPGPVNQPVWRSRPRRRNFRYEIALEDVSCPGP